MSSGFGELTTQAHDLVSAGDLTGAQELLGDALLAADPDPGNASPELAEAAGLQARLLLALGDAESARTWAAFAHAAYGHLLGPEDARTVAATATLAAILHRLGDQAQASLLYRDVIIELTATDGPESLRVLAAHADLATVEYARGECALARNRLADAWELHREVYGDGHLSGIKMLARLAAMERDCGEIARSLQHFALAQQLCRENLPADHPLATQVDALAATPADRGHVCGDDREPSAAREAPAARGASDDRDVPGYPYDDGRHGTGAGGYDAPAPVTGGYHDTGPYDAPVTHGDAGTAGYGYGYATADEREPDGYGGLPARERFAGDVDRAGGFDSGGDGSGRLPTGGAAYGSGGFGSVAPADSFSDQDASVPPLAAPAPGVRIVDRGAPYGRPVGDRLPERRQPARPPVPIYHPPPRAGRRGMPMVVAGLTVVGLGAAAVIAGFALVGGAPDAEPTPATTTPEPTVGGSSPAPRPSQSPLAKPGSPPTGVALKDTRDNVTLSWTYPDGAEGPVVVSGGRAGQQPRAFEQLPAGTTRYIVYGLNKTNDYCFTIAVVWSADSVGRSEPVCTTRSRRPNSR